MTSTALVGSTGLVGSQILTTLLALPSISSVHSFARRAPSQSDAKLQAHTSAETSSWAENVKSVVPAPSIFFSALGTTRGAAGSVANQRLIDYDLNLSLAQAAQAAGTKVYVLISTSGANASSSMAYPRMKGELDEAVKGLGFDTVVILKPGLLLGDRAESRPAEFVVRKIAGVVGLLGHKATDSWAQDANTVGRAAVSAGLQALEGGKGKVWEVNMSEIVRLGRTEWKA